MLKFGHQHAAGLLGVETAKVDVRGLLTERFEPICLSTQGVELSEAGLPHENSLSCIDLRQGRALVAEADGYLECGSSKCLSGNL
ncbi:hypothetical protein GCM10022629_18350 [Amorphoplanes auranticolor]